MVAFTTSIRRISQFVDITLFVYISNLMRYYLGSCEYKWKHVDSQLEPVWIQREVTAELYSIIEENNWEWVLLRSNSQTLPGDTYCRCDIYVDIDDSKHATHFVLKYPQVKLVEKIL